MGTKESKYDSFLYGYGLSLAVFDEINKLGEISKYNDYLSLNKFFKIFIEAKEHSFLKKRFNKLFDIRGEKEIKAIKEDLKFIDENYDEITKYGFERWVSKELFNIENPISSGVKLLSCIIHNYWYDQVNEEILSKKVAKKRIGEISKSILTQLSGVDNIYTTNFENLLDGHLKPQHIHGSFTLPFFKASEIICKETYSKNKAEFEYNFMFGTNGYEKATRLFGLKGVKSPTYDLDFFFSDSIELGHLLIYGLSFGKAEFVPQELAEKHGVYMINLVDGHIVLRLNALLRQGKLDRITVAYYSESDLSHYQEIFKMAQIEHIITYKHCSEVFQL